MLAIVLACAVLTYGGVSLFVVGFAVFPIALSLFYEGDVPRRFIPGALAFGSVTFTMTSAGSPEIQNLIPIEYLDTTPTAGLVVSAIVAVAMFAMFAMGFVGLMWLVNRAVANGETFEAMPGDERYIGHLLRRDERIPDDGSSDNATGPQPTTVEDDDDLPPVLLALVPIAVILVLLNVLGVAPEASLFGGVLMAWLPFYRWLPNPLDTAVVGSASGGLSIILPIIGPQYLDQGVDADSLHRVSAIASGSIDSLPHSGYVVTTIRVICGETHTRAYLPIFVTTVVVPLIGVVLAVVLFGLGL